MAVRAPTWLTDALRWRWMPTVALVLGSLLYVIGALIVVPSNIQFSAANPNARTQGSTLNGSSLNGSALGASIEPVAQEGDSVENAEEVAPSTSRRSKRARRRAAQTDEGAATAEPTEEAAP